MGYNKLNNYTRIKDDKISLETSSLNFANSNFEDLKADKNIANIKKWIIQSGKKIYV